MVVYLTACPDCQEDLRPSIRRHIESRHMVDSKGACPIDGCTFLTPEGRVDAMPDHWAKVHNHYLVGDEKGMSLERSHITRKGKGLLLQIITEEFDELKAIKTQIRHYEDLLQAYDPAHVRQHDFALPADLAGMRRTDLVDVLIEVRTQLYEKDWAAVLDGLMDLENNAFIKKQRSETNGL